MSIQSTAEHQIAHEIWTDTNQQQPKKGVSFFNRKPSLSLVSTLHCLLYSIASIFASITFIDSTGIRTKGYTSSLGRWIDRAGDVLDLGLIKVITFLKNKNLYFTFEKVESTQLRRLVCYFVIHQIFESVMTNMSTAPLSRRKLLSCVLLDLDGTLLNTGESSSFVCGLFR